MPKEKIDDFVTDQFSVTVGWERDKYVQIATVYNPGAKNAYAAIEEMKAEGEAFTGWHTTLDRDHINRLIRVLRRARDQTFGRDE